MLRGDGGRAGRRLRVAQAVQAGWFRRSEARLPFRRRVRRWLFGVLVSLPVLLVVVLVWDVWRQGGLTG